MALPPPIGRKKEEYGISRLGADLPPPGPVAGSTGGAGEPKTPFPTIAACILDSYARRIGRELLHRSGDLLDDAKRLLAYEAIVLSHDAGVDPRFVYANSAAASLWRISVEDMIGMPSRLSAPADAREDRARMLSDASRDGVLSGYSGERVARDGTRFRIIDATLWTVDGYPDGPGQAVVFSRWKPIDDI